MLISERKPNQNSWTVYTQQKKGWTGWNGHSFLCSLECCVYVQNVSVFSAGQLVQTGHVSKSKIWSILWSLITTFSLTYREIRAEKNQRRAQNAMSLQCPVCAVSQSVALCQCCVTFTLCHTQYWLDALCSLLSLETRSSSGWCGSCAALLWCGWEEVGWRLMSSWSRTTHVEVT